MSRIVSETVKVIGESENAFGDVQIDWEQRRYEIAKDAMLGIIANSNDDDYRYIERGWSQDYKYKLQREDIVRRAVLYADALIAELQMEMNR